MPEPVRIQKALADAGVASRRAADALVRAGRVTVNGATARTGSASTRRTTSSRSTGGPSCRPGRRTYLAMHKPAGVTSTVRDRHAERTVLDLVPPDIRAGGGRLYPVGRLDRDSEGLLLLTNDGDWAQRLLHPRYGVEREYAVGLARRRSTPGQRSALAARRRARGGPRAPRRACVGRLAPRPRVCEGLGGRSPDAAGLVSGVLTQGWKRQLRRMFAAVGQRRSCASCACASARCGSATWRRATCDRSRAAERGATSQQGRLGR